MDEKMLARMMQALDGELSSDERTGPDAHLVHSDDLGEEWDRLQALDEMLRREPMAYPPMGFTGRVMARVDRRRHRQRVLFGGAALGFGAVAAAMLLVLVPLLSLPPVSGGVLPLVEAGRVSAVGLGEMAFALLTSVWVTADALVMRLLPVALCGFSLALVANLLWLGLIRKLHRARVRA